jgi:hypothetical protein
VQPEGLSQRRMSKNLSGIKPATFRFVAQWINYLRYRYAQYKKASTKLRQAKITAKFPSSNWQLRCSKGYSPASNRGEPSFRSVRDRYVVDKVALRQDYFPSDTCLLPVLLICHRRNMTSATYRVFKRRLSLTFSSLAQTETYLWHT